MIDTLVTEYLFSCKYSLLDLVDSSKDFDSLAKRVEVNPKCLERCFALRDQNRTIKRAPHNRIAMPTETCRPQVSTKIENKIFSDV